MDSFKNFKKLTSKEMKHVIGGVGGPGDGCRTSTTCSLGCLDTNDRCSSCCIASATNP